MNLSRKYPPANKGTVIVWGQMIAQPFGGMIWQVLHYMAPLRELGFDVWYVEDSDRMVYHPVTFEQVYDYTENTRLIDSYLRQAGFGDRWIYRPSEVYDRCVGAKDFQGLLELYRMADAVFNLCGSQEPRDWHEGIRCRVYVETDPVKDQVEVAQGDEWRIYELGLYDFLFTYGENLGQADCRVPIERFEWHPTRPPVELDWWQTDSPPASDSPLTTIANWKHTAKDVIWQGEQWRWSKHYEFEKFIDLPLRSSLPLELAVGAIEDEDRENLQQHGWRTVFAKGITDPDDYRKYIQKSRGEFTVAKEQYIVPRTGWFSDRSVCYLAAGRPVITQDTRFDKFIPTGRGLFSYSTEDEAAEAIEAIGRDYAGHCRAAREIAGDYFCGKTVVGDMLRKIGLV